MAEKKSGQTKYHDYDWLVRQKPSKELVAANKLAQRYAEEVYTKWDIDFDSVDPESGEWVLEQGTLVTSRDFGKRFGYYTETGIFEDWYAAKQIYSEALGISELYYEMEKIAPDLDAAFQDYKKNELPKGSYALSLELCIAALRAHLEVGSFAGALYTVFRFGRVAAYFETHRHEEDLEKRAKTYPSSGGRAKKTKPDIREKVIQKVLELRATSTKSDSAIYQEVGKDPDLPHKSTVRRIMLEYASKK